MLNTDSTIPRAGVLDCMKRKNPAITSISLSSLPSSPPPSPSFCLFAVNTRWQLPHITATVTPITTFTLKLWAKIYLFSIKCLRQAICQNNKKGKYYTLQLISVMENENQHQIVTLQVQAEHFLIISCSFSHLGEMIVLPISQTAWRHRGRRV